MSPYFPRFRLLHAAVETKITIDEYAIGSITILANGLLVVKRANKLTTAIAPILRFIFSLKAKKAPKAKYDNCPGN